MPSWTTTRPTPRTRYRECRAPRCLYQPGEAQVALGPASQRGAQPRPPRADRQPEPWRPARSPTSRKRIASRWTTSGTRTTRSPTGGPIRFCRADSDVPAICLPLGPRARAAAADREDRRVVLPLHHRPLRHRRARHDPVAQTAVSRHREDHGRRRRVLQPASGSHCDHRIADRRFERRRSCVKTASRPPSFSVNGPRKGGAATSLDL